MRIVDSLAIIRQSWLLKISRRLARGEGVRESFVEQLNRFFDLLTQAVDSGDPAWLNPILDEWVEARTQSELENRESSLPPILDQILQLTIEACRECLEPLAALEVIATVMPIYTYTFEYTTRRETDLHIDHIARKLDEAKGRLERLDKSKSDFIAIAAHELKTPLTLIEGYSSMLRDQLPNQSGDGAPGLLLKGVDNGTRRLREIVDDMIDVSMIDNNLLSLNFQPVWLNRLLQLIEREFVPVVRERRLTLDIRPFPGSDEMTFGDGERLFQALRNVVSNAIKYTPDGGRIVVNGRKLPGFVEVTVADTGIGIDPEDHSKIFEKFGRLGDVSLHSSGKTKFKGGGPGLGLPITKGIVEAHGGAIWVESDGYSECDCPGAIFHILLPLRREPPDDKTARLFGTLVEGDRSQFPIQVNNGEETS
jgi:signal transduction histidine kinase